MGIALTSKWWARTLPERIGIVTAICGVSLLLGQSQEPPSPVFKVNVVSKSTKAINYRHRSGSTTINFVGTALMPKAQGQAKVDSRPGAISIDATFKDVGAPGQFGSEYRRMCCGRSHPKEGQRTLGRSCWTAARVASR
jgi:hypothetical protein